MLVLVGDEIIYEELGEVDTSPIPETEIKRKTLTLDLATGLKAVDAERGIIEAIVSVTGNTDSDGERFRPGSWKKWLKRRRPKGVHAHNWSQPTAKTLKAEELMPGDERLPVKLVKAGYGGLLIVGQYNLTTQRGREAFSDVVFFGKEAEFSVGFRAHRMVDATEAEQSDDPEFRAWIEEAELYEWSDVLFGANPETQILALKGARSEVVDWMADIARGTGLKDADINREVLESRAGDLLRRFSAQGLMLSKGGAAVEKEAKRQLVEKDATPWARRTVTEADLEPDGFACAGAGCETVFAADDTYVLQPLSDGVFLCVCESCATEPEPVKSDPGEACTTCSVEDSELVMLDGAGYCEDCTKAMREAADLVVKRVPFPVTALAEMSS